MHLGLFISAYGALLLVSALAVCYGRGVDASRQSLLGIWRGDFSIDYPAPGPARDDVPSLPSRLTIHFAADTAPEWWPLRPWQRAFSGRYTPPRGRRIESDFVGHALAVRYDRDSVWFALGPPCCDTGGIVARGAIARDTVVGRWYIDSDGLVATGEFRLVRDSRAAPRAQN